jgi:hypothetical protein
MQLARSGIAQDPRRFGRGRVRQLAAPELQASVSDDLKLFGSTFLAGFVFVSLLLA